jgi:hypothetical protein
MARQRETSGGSAQALALLNRYRPRNTEALKARVSASNSRKGVAPMSLSRYLTPFALAGALLLALAPSAAADDPPPPTYETRYANGTIVWVGKSAGLEVRLSAEMRDDLALILYVVNDTDQPVTFYPEQVRVEAIRRKKDVVTREPVRMFPADEYVSRLNTSLAWKSLFAGMGNYQEPEPETYTTSSKTDGRVYDWSSGATVSGSSTSSGTVTKQVTDADRQAAQDRTQAKTAAELAPEEARAKRIAARLMRTQTLDPHMGYGGTVFAKSKGKEYVATVPFGDTEFQFSFAFK